MGKCLTWTLSRVLIVLTLGLLLYKLWLEFGPQCHSHVTAGPCPPSHIFSIAFCAKDTLN